MLLSKKGLFSMPLKVWIMIAFLYTSLVIMNKEVRHLL